MALEDPACHFALLRGLEPGKLETCQRDTKLIHYNWKLGAW